MPQKIPLYYALPAILLSTLLVAAIIWAWTEPAIAPPGGNVPAPINVSSNTQLKSGSLAVAGAAFEAYNDTFLATLGGNVGIGTVTPSTKLHVVGGARITGLDSCNTIDTDASGNLICGTDEGGGGGGLWTDGGTYIYPNNAGTGFQISDGGNIILPDNATVDGVDISDYSPYFIDSAGVSGQVWKSDGSGRGVWGTDETGAGGSWICTDHDGTGLACSGENLYVETYYRGAEARCGDDDFLRGDGVCRNATEVVSAGGGGGGLWTDGGTYIYPDNVGTSFRVSDTGDIVLPSNAEVDGVDISDYSDFFISSAGTNGNVWTSDGSGRGYWGSGGGSLDEGAVMSCTGSGTSPNSVVYCRTNSCPAGTVRTGCSGGYDLTNAGHNVYYFEARNYSTNRCECRAMRGTYVTGGTLYVYCYAYCTEF